MVTISVDLLDLVNLGAGFYKGYLNASGVQVNPGYMAYALGGTSLWRGVSDGISAHRANNHPLLKSTGSLASMVGLTPDEFKQSPIKTGVSSAVIKGGFFGSLEIALGYGLGLIAHKVIN